MFARRFRQSSSALRLYRSDLRSVSLLHVLYRTVFVIRWSGYDAGLRAVIARAPQLLRVTFTHVNRLTPALLPANYNCGSVVAVEPVVCGKCFRGLPSPEPPLSAACAIAFRRHPLILPNPCYRTPQANKLPLRNG